MTGELLIRLGIAAGLAAMGWGGYLMFNWALLYRASHKKLGLEGFKPGKPAILYFTTPHCQPCKTIQRPALARLAGLVGDAVTVIQVDAQERPDLAEAWGVLSVPTTFLIDSSGEPRGVNHGTASAEKLLGQLARIEGKPLEKLTAETQAAQEQPASLGSD